MCWIRSVTHVRQHGVCSQAVRAWCLCRCLLLSCLLYLYSFTKRPVPTRVLSTQVLTATEGARPEAFKGSSHLFHGWISVSIYPSIDVDTENPDYVHICSRLFHPGPALSLGYYCVHSPSSSTSYLHVSNPFLHRNQQPAESSSPLHSRLVYAA